MCATDCHSCMQSVEGALCNVAKSDRLPCRKLKSDRRVEPKMCVIVVVNTSVEVGRGRLLALPSLNCITA